MRFNSHLEFRYFGRQHFDLVAFQHIELVVDIVRCLSAPLSTHQLLYHGIDPFLFGFDYHGGIHRVLGHLVTQRNVGSKHGQHRTENKVRPIGQVILKDDFLQRNNVWLEVFFAIGVVVLLHGLFHQTVNKKHQNAQSTGNAGNQRNYSHVGFHKLQLIGLYVYNVVGL